MKKILIAGGSGFIGQRLTALLLAEPNTKVAWLSRNNKKNAPVEVFEWNPAAHEMDISALEGVTAVVNLAGAGIADQRWTKSRKALIINSRTESIKTLEKAILARQSKPNCYISASAIGFYGNRDEEKLTENSAPGSGFLTESTLAWEEANQNLMVNPDLRSIILRIGIVLDKGGGALAEIEKPIRFGIGAYFENGRAWYSWIHREDVCRMILWAMENQMTKGIYNAVAPQPVRNIELVKAIQKAKNSFAISVPAPALAMRLAMGEMADVVLNSSHVSSENIEKTGFSFKYPNLEVALKAIYG